MKRQTKISNKVFLSIAAVLLFSLASCKKDNNVQTEKTIDGIVSTTPDFSTLNAAVMKGGLANTLDGSGPFTVFAPNNGAFSASGITSDVLNGLTTDQVKNILLYHTVAAKITAAEVPAGPNAPVAAANGDSLYVTNNSSGVFVNGTKVTQADVAASNGIIHVIENVLMPPVGNIVETAQADTTFSFLVAAIVRASEGSVNVAQVLSGPGPFTVFAPTNNAFRAAGFPTLASIQAADPNTLATILTYHVVGARVFSSDLTDGEQVPTLNGGKITVGLSSGATVKGSSNATVSNIIANKYNGN